MQKTILEQAVALTLPLIRREIANRYRGSVLGVVWSLLLPLFMLTIYTVFFGVVLEARWNIPDRIDTDPSTAQFGVILFAGLLLHQFLAESIGSSPNMILSNANYVKKVVFPLHILSIINLGTSLFHAAVAFGIFFVFSLFVFGPPSLTILLAPLAFASLVPMVLGISWFLSAVGVYFRDVGQIIQPLLAAMLFLSPILFPRAAMPEWLQPFLLLNPLTIPVETLRNTALFGVQPEWSALAMHGLVGLVIAGLGLAFFQLTRKGFADVV